MGTVYVECWKCDVCGHRWIKTGSMPTHCTSKKCRSRRWDWRKYESGDGDALLKVANKAVREGKVDAVIEKREKRKEYGWSGEKPKMNGAMAAFLEQKMVLSEESVVREEPKEMCNYKEYDYESGETMGCGLERHGLKVKHGAWRRL